MATRYLTKSRFKLALECPTKLFYAGKPTEYRDVMQENDFLAMLAEGGYQVGELAKLLFPGGIEITGLDHSAAEAQTRECLLKENVILFEPAIRVGNFFIRIDILVKSGNRFELIEVKAKSYNSLEPNIEGKRNNIKSDMLPYIQDAAFQTWVLRQAFPQTDIKTFLIMPDKSKLSPYDGINQMFKISKRERGFNVESRIPEGLDVEMLGKSLLEKVCVDQYVTQVLSNPLKFPGGIQYLSDAVAEWARAYSIDEKIPPIIGEHCGKCQFKEVSSGTTRSGFKECWSQVAGLNDRDFECGTVLDLWNFRGKQKLIDQGVFKISQVNQEDLGTFDDEPDDTGLSRAQRQWLQAGGIPSSHPYHGFYFDDALVAKEMAQWKFPLHFIDFETSSVALPFYKGMRPYEPVAFQFSHHVMEADGSVRHAGEFLCTEPGKFPNFEFIKALKAELDNDEGSVFMWSHHENTILSKIVDQLVNVPNSPNDRNTLIEFTQSLTKGGNREMIDLCVLAGKAFFHPDTKGSNSIKKVLPAVLKISSFLRDTYSQPIYGAQTGIKSLNFTDPIGFVWLDETNDPYAKLKELARTFLPEGVSDESLIAEGGAAATAYARLQFEDMDAEARDRINAALLRYCELDTLAMVMVVQAWRDLLSKAS
ncbi:MAG: DUF2779 domain-containing protein [Bdellovibrionales bacterium]|nr:DUF2779 domain-containing protein [Bdellovibrionales bacterium]